MFALRPPHHPIFLRLPPPPSPRRLITNEQPLDCLPIYCLVAFLVCLTHYDFNFFFTQTTNVVVIQQPGMVLTPANKLPPPEN